MPASLDDDVDDFDDESFCVVVLPPSLGAGVDGRGGALSCVVVSPGELPEPSLFAKVALEPDSSILYSSATTFSESATDVTVRPSSTVTAISEPSMVPPSIVMFLASIVAALSPKSIEAFSCVVLSTFTTETDTPVPTEVESPTRLFSIASLEESSAVWV